MIYWLQKLRVLIISFVIQKDIFKKLLDREIEMCVYFTEYFVLVLR